MSNEDEPLAAALAFALAASEVRETHCSWVFLTADRAFKLKKPVRFGFVDLSTPLLRRQACGDEVRVNQELAPQIVLGVRSVLSAPSGYRLGDADDPAALDWVVEMRRFDEAFTMAARATSGALTRDDATAVGRRIAAFHERARLVPGDSSATAIRAAWDRNLDELAAAGGGDVADARQALMAFADAFVDSRGVELDARAAAGLVREGHGDLRAEHVLLEDGVTIVDRLEFDPALREVDVADDVSFLLMDLEALGVRWAADAVLAGYREAGGDAGDDRLLAFFGAYRASVRAKVELLRAAQVHEGELEASGRSRAHGLLGLAEHLAWRARPPATIVVCGPPASGKSHLAAALAARTRGVIVSSDAVRKEQLGLDVSDTAPESAYTEAERERVYEELARRVNALPADASAIVDATFGTREMRRRFVSHLDDLRRASLRWAECEAPVAALEERARRRKAGAVAGGSDAGPGVVARLASAFEPLDEVEPARHVRVDTTAPTAAALRSLGLWLDGRSAQDVVDRSPGRQRGARSMAGAKQQLGVPRSLRDGGHTAT